MLYLDINSSATILILANMSSLAFVLYNTLSLEGTGTNPSLSPNLKAIGTCNELIPNLEKFWLYILYIRKNRQNILK